jgi:uncharacterized protein (TIGR00251 family)
MILMEDLSALHQRLRDDGAVSFSIRARPGARKSEVTGIMDDGSVKISVAAPPEEGKANAELVRFLAEEFGVGRENVEIVSGGGGRRKAVRIRR